MHRLLRVLFVALTLLSAAKLITSDSVEYFSSPKTIDFNLQSTPDPTATEMALRKEDFDGLRKIIAISGNSSYGTTAAGFFNTHNFNVTLHLTVPLFYFQLPGKVGDDAGDTVDLANQAIIGMFSLLVIVGTLSVPVILARPHPFSSRSSSDSSSGGIMDRLTHSKKLIDFIEADMLSQIGLDKDKCLKKTICQAHRFPDKYGLFGLPFRIFYPPPSEGASARASSYQIAAGVGKYTQKNCRKRFFCFFDFLDLANYAVDSWYSGSISKAISFV